MVERAIGLPNWALAYIKPVSCAGTRERAAPPLPASQSTRKHPTLDHRRAPRGGRRPTARHFRAAAFTAGERDAPALSRPANAAIVAPDGRPVPPLDRRPPTRSARRDGDPRMRSFRASFAAGERGAPFRFSRPTDAAPRPAKVATSRRSIVARRHVGCASDGTHDGRRFRAARDFALPRRSSPQSSPAHVERAPAGEPRRGDAVGPRRPPPARFAPALKS